MAARFQWPSHGTAVSPWQPETADPQCSQGTQSHGSSWIVSEPPVYVHTGQHSEGWATALREAAKNLRDMLQIHRRLGRLEAEVATLKNDLIRYRDSQSEVIPITTLAPESVAVLRDIPVVVRPTEDGFLATLFDANIGMTGDTQEEAVENLKALLVDVFEQLEREENQLGPGPQRQLATLRSFIKRQD